MSVVSLVRRSAPFAFAVLVMGVVPAVSMTLNQADAPASRTASEPGEAWRIDAETTVAGISLPANSDTVCLSPEDRRNPPKSLSNAQCPQQEITREGDTIRWVAKCSQADAQGEVTFRDDGTMTGKVTGEKGGSRIEMTLSGRKVGACTNS